MFYKVNEFFLMFFFDYWGLFQSKLFGIHGVLMVEQIWMVVSYKWIIFDGFLWVLDDGVLSDQVVIFVDEQFGKQIFVFFCKVLWKIVCFIEKFGQEEFDFEYGEEFVCYIETVDFDFVKVFV